MLPEAFLQRMKELLGEDFDAFLDSYDQKANQALRLNGLKSGEKGALPEWVGSQFHLTKVPWADDGYYYESVDAPGRHPYHEAGLYYIQEPSAMAPAGLLDVRPGQKVLDLCAAPGGKSMQLAARLEGRGLLISNEIHPARCRILSENMERLGVRNACVTNETPENLARTFVEYFDRILVDAPCSGEGMFRKNEAAREEWSPENVRLCGDRQDEILECAAGMLRPGGRLVYSTCTFAPVENEGTVSRFLKRHKEFAIVPIDKSRLGLLAGEQAGKPSAFDGVASCVEDAAEGIEGTLRLWPHLIRGEGHYAAVLEKAGQQPQTGTESTSGDGARREREEPLPVGGLEPGLTWEKLRRQKDMADFTAFCQETLRSEELLTPEGKFLRFGDNLYLVPESMPTLRGLKVLRPGLHMGTLKKNRFEPSHALALALSPHKVRHVWRLSAEDDTLAAYLNGQTFPAEGEKGWYLICVDGFGIGWGKLAGGVMKNHYPKGLRKNW